MAVYSPATDAQYAQVAEKIAENRGDLLISEIDPASDDTILYVGAPEDIKERDLLALQCRQLKSNGNAEFGVITGRTADSALALHEREAVEEDEHTILLRQVDEDIYSHDPGLEILTREDSDFENVRSTFERTSSLSTIIDGRGIHSYLNDGYICGYPSDRNRHEFDGYQPPCVTVDGIECPYDGELMFADEVDIPHIFYNSCSSLIPNSPTGMPVSVGQGLLENATSVIGGYRTMTAYPHETTLHYNLLRAGYTASERCYILNRTSHAQQLKAYPYVPYGRPSVQVSEPTDQKYDVSLADSTDGFTVTLSDVQCNIVDITLPTVFNGDQIFVKNTTGRFEDAPLFYSAFTEAGETRLLVYTWGGLAAERLEFEVAGQRDHRPSYSIVQAASKNSHLYDFLNISNRKVRGQLESFENQALSVSREQYTERYHTNGWTDVVGKLANGIDQIDAIHDRMIQVLSNRRSGFIANDYANRVSIVDIGTHDHDCYNCGRPLFTQTVESFEQHVEREISFCPRCSKVFDVPVTESGTTYPQLSMEKHDDHVEFTVTFTNSSGDYLRTICYPWIKKDVGNVEQGAAFLPESQQTIIPPNATETFSFEVNTGVLSETAYTVYAFVLPNLDVHVGMHRLIL